MLMLQMLVPSNAVGFLLGKRGENIQRLNRETHCTLSVRDSRFADDRVLRVYGLMDDICAAQRLVLDGIRQHRVDKQDPNYMNLANQGLVPLPDSSLSETTTTALSAFMRRRGSDDDEDDEDVQVVRWLVRHDQVGKIMGHGGATLTAIANQTGTKLSVSSIRDMPPGSNERVVTITGSTDAVEHARQMIEDIAGGRAKDPGFNGKRGQYFAIPLQSSGPLIGPNGATIKNIAERTGARLQIAAIQDLPLGSINRTLHIQGSAKQIKHAFSLVCNKIRELQNSKRKNSTTTNADEVSFRLILPIRVCSRLLNQRGARIRGIIETSGAHARFLDPQDDDTRICVVSGDLENVLHAQRLILGVLASESGGAGRRGSGSSGGSAVPRKRKQRDEEEDEDVETITERSTARPRNPNGRKVTLVNADGGRRQQQKKPRLL
ncbi:TPA: hypothetical protein N0F65_011808 [Lagenidium giganteum]|uniref:K Homology domain-containing protein n=1 Tax=Lagenidium giganteum TaxID=4803 RepID=A0AAV2YVI1_9STRA|nr:TPA: hypothetical protein N0F65_011808 [Lagenidium giganteum]